MIAQVGRNAERQDRADGLGPKDEHAVGAADAPNLGATNPPTAVSGSSTMDSDKLLSLADLCEAAKGRPTNRELDRGIAEAMGDDLPSDGVWSSTPYWTSSIDSAISLVPDAVEIIEVKRSGRSGSWSAYLNVSPSADAVAEVGYASTPALALCAAALRARSHAQQVKS